MKQTTIGVREARANLSRLLKMVQKGHEFTLSHRGRPVGRLVPVTCGSLSPDEQVKRLEEAGLLERCEPRSGRAIPRPIPVPGGMAQAFLREDREDGGR